MRYVPIPPVELDPQSDREILENSLEKVREESNGLLTDLSESDPIRAIVEGQVFAYGEFLSYFNQIPDAILTEWIGPFLGAQRRAGSSSLVEVVITLSNPTPSNLTINEGFTVNTEPSLNAGVRRAYTLTNSVTISAGSSQVTGTFRCTTRGQSGNCLANSITVFQPLSGISSVNNPNPGFGGEDVETLTETKERFLSLIRRRVPVSETDWIGVFQDLLGVRTTCFIKPQGKGYIQFQVLKEGKEELSEAEKGIVFRLIRNLVPAGTTVDIRDIPKRYINIDMEVDYSNLNLAEREVTDAVNEAIGNSLLELPQNSTLSLVDVSAWVSANLGIGEPYLNPKVVSIKGYKQPDRVFPSRFRGRNLAFLPNFRLEVGDLVEDSFGDYYPVLENFNPRSYDRNYYSSIRNLELKVVKEYLAGAEYKVGDVLADGSNYRLVEKPFFASGDYAEDITNGNVGLEVFVNSWAPNTLYVKDALVETGSEITAYIPTSGVGSAIWKVATQFTSEDNTNDITVLQTQNLLDVNPVSTLSLVEGQSYTAGQYIKTPEITLEDDYDETFYYVDPEEGALEKFFLVTSDFTASNTIFSISGEIGALEADGKLREVTLEDNLTSYSSNLYRARLPLGSTVYSGEQVYLVAREFTPFTQNVETLVSGGNLIPLDNFTATESVPLFELNVGDNVVVRTRGGRKFFRVNTPFTQVYNTEVYEPYLDPINTAKETVRFSDSSRPVEDTLFWDGEYYKVVFPFTPEDSSVDLLENFGYLQKLEVEVGSDVIQLGGDYVADKGSIIITRNGGGSYFYPKEGSTSLLLPSFRGSSLF